MKILVLADVHGGKWRVDDLIPRTSPDVIVVPGDLPSSIDIPVLIYSLAKGRNRHYYTKQVY
ncbi:MAG: metallophosphoesterase, partial [Candidatus Kariarchaeaceae archaeon]